MAAVAICSDFGAQKNKVCHYSTVSPSICHEVMGLDGMILVFWMLSFKPTFSLSTFTFIKRLFQHQGLIQWVSSSHQVAKVLEFQLRHQSFQWIPRTDFLKDGLAGSPCSPRNSQESSPTPQFKSIDFSVLSFPYSPTLTSIHDYWENHSFD